MFSASCIDLVKQLIGYRTKFLLISNDPCHFAKRLLSEDGSNRRTF
uniref:Uncharacterized protein n=1 Tax=Anguilla anguilla TaxID=7936 RepID=A0A0E9SQV2_ANGAN